MNKKAIDFDDFADDYRQIHSQNIKITGENSEYFSEYKILGLAKFLEKNNPLKILDYGCGDGGSEVYFEKYFPKASILGIDVSNQSLKIATQKKLKNSTFLTFDGSTIPSNSQTFDVIFAACVFHHIEGNKHIEVLQEFFRVLKDGGLVVVFEHNRLNPLTRKAVWKCKFDEGVKLVSVFDLKKKMKRAGFKNFCTNFTLFMPRYKFFKPFLFLENYLKKLPIGGQYYISAQK